MAKNLSKYGFVECADLISEQKYAPALKMFQRAVSKFLESKSAPKRGEIARQLLHIGTALEETLTKAYGEKWGNHIPKFSEEKKQSSCSFCGKNQKEVGKLIGGPSVHICVECVNLCKDIVSQEADAEDAATIVKTASAKSTEDRLCGICMEARETDELIFLPHAAYMCAGCLEDMQAIRDKHAEK